MELGLTELASPLSSSRHRTKAASWLGGWSGASAAYANVSQASEIVQFCLGVCTDRRV